MRQVRRRDGRMQSRPPRGHRTVATTARTDVRVRVGTATVVFVFIVLVILFTDEGTANTKTEVSGADRRAVSAPELCLRLLCAALRVRTSDSSSSSSDPCPSSA